MNKAVRLEWGGLGSDIWNLSRPNVSAKFKVMRRRFLIFGILQNSAKLFRAKMSPAFNCLPRPGQDINILLAILIRKPQE